MPLTVPGAFASPTSSRRQNFEPRPQAPTLPLGAERAITVVADASTSTSASSLVPALA